MKSFYVITYDINSRQFKPYDVIPYLVGVYNKIKTDKEWSKIKSLPTTFDEFKKFIKDESVYRWWARCEYEIILTDWPCKCEEEKWDVYDQVMMNIDVITNILMEEVVK